MILWTSKVTGVKVVLGDACEPWVLEEAELSKAEVVVAATGDHGYPGAGTDNYPAAFAGVTAAGGTTLALASGGQGVRGYAESAWSLSGGWGGSSVVMDLDRKLTFTYVMNKMGVGISGNERTHAYANKVYEALGDNSVGAPWAMPAKI